MERRTRNNKSSTQRRGRMQKKNPNYIVANITYKLRKSNLKRHPLHTEMERAQHNKTDDNEIHQTENLDPE
jgi:hypothetical protein